MGKKTLSYGTYYAALGWVARSILCISGLFVVVYPWVIGYSIVATGDVVIYSLIVWFMVGGAYRLLYNFFCKTHYIIHVQGVTIVLGGLWRRHIASKHIDTITPFECSIPWWRGIGIKHLPFMYKSQRYSLYTTSYQNPYAITMHNNHTIVITPRPRAVMSSR